MPALTVMRLHRDASPLVRDVHLRVSSLGGVRGSGHGRSDWERDYYGAHIRELVARP